MQETRWTGGKSGKNRKDGCKLYFSGGKQPRNSVGICLSDYWQDKVIAVERSDRIIAMKMIIPGMSINIVSAFAPQQGCSQERDLFWNQLDGILNGIPEGKELMLAGEGIELEWNDDTEDGHLERETNMASVYCGWLGYDLALVNTFLRTKDKKQGYKQIHLILVPIGYSACEVLEHIC